MKVNIFALNIFHHLTYDREINGLLIANISPRLPKYYTPKKLLKRLNFKVLQSFFPKIIFDNTEDNKTAESFISFGTSIAMLISIIENHFYHKKKLELFFFYHYLKIFS